MPSFIIGTFTNTQRNLSLFEGGIVTQTGSVAVLGDSAITANGSNDLVINGTVASDKVAIFATGVDLDLAVGAQGSVLSTGSYGLFANVSSTTEVVNDGTILSAESIGVALFASGAAVRHALVNSGTISSEITGVYIEARGPGISRIVNIGTIVGGEVGINSSDVTDAVLEVWNSGTISGGSFYSFYGNSDDGGGTSSDRVHNAGLMQGDILLEGGDDLYDGRGGTVIGTVSGGFGDDTFIIDDASIDLVENSGEGTDEVRSTVSYILGDNFEALTLLGADDLRGIGNGANNAITGNRGDNVLRGLLGNDTIWGDNGDDLIYGGAGNDVVSAGNNDDRVYGGLGNDTIFGGNGDDRLLGEDGNDRLLGQGGNDFILGGLGNDVLNGGGGDDVMQGGAGFDVFNGSTGNDTMSGNFNADTFVFANGFGVDVITDFAATNNFEKINLAAVATIVNFADLAANHMTQAGGNVVIDALGGNTITLLGVNIGDLDANDFVF